MQEPSSEQLRQLLQHSEDMACLANLEGYLTWVNPAWERVLGRSQEEMTSTPFIDFVHPDDVESTLAELASLGDGADTVGFTNRYRHADGTYRWIEWNTIPGDEGVLYCIARDVTARRKVELARSEQLEMLELASELAAVGHWRVLVQSGQLRWSRRVFEIHGRDPAKGEPPLQGGIDYYHPDDRDRVSKCVQDAVEAQQEFRFDCRIVRDDGVVRDVRSIGRPLVVDGEVVEIFGVFQDVTAEKAIQRRLQHAEKLASVGTLAAGMAHEINNPLSYVELNTEVLEEELQSIAGLSPSPQAAEMVDLITDVRDGVHRIQRIVLGLKSFARTREHVRKSVDAVQAIETALRLVHNETKHHAMVTRTLPEQALVLADEGQLVQVLVNLVMNAAQAMPPGRRLIHNEVRVFARLEGDRIAVGVSDNGTGMPPDIRDRALEPFFTTKTNSNGTGLGLFVAKGIAEAHGGELVIDTLVDHGTTITLYLPCAPTEHATPSQPARRMHARLLVIDDEPKVAKSIARSVRPHESIIETDPAEAVVTIEERGHQFDLILCDLMMPGLRGEEVYEAVPADLKHKIVFMTGGTFTPGAEAFAERMGDRVLPKPPNRELLKHLLEGALMVSSDRNR
jgi:PAS domain S-box-containing protein